MKIFGNILFFLIAFSSLIHAEDITPEFKHFKNNSGRVTGLPIPRFVSLKRENTNMRAGPGQSYGIKWQYHKKGLPVEVINEYAHWRKVSDIDGSQGWIHYALLSGKRMLVTIAGNHLLYAKNNTHAQIIAKISSGVILTPQKCTLKWCFVTYKDLEGWMQKDILYGVYPEEIIQ